MMTEDDLARDLRRGTTTVDQAIEELESGNVLVYAQQGFDPAKSEQPRVGKVRRDRC